MPRPSSPNSISSTGRCAADGLQRCNDDGSDYLPVETCGPRHACRDGGCHGVICGPGTRVCQGDVLKECDVSGTLFTETDCLAVDSLCQGYGASAECGPQACVPGSTTCNAEETAVVRCDERGADTTTHTDTGLAADAGPVRDGFKICELGLSERLILTAGN